jgi:hypothetical protein
MRDLCFIVVSSVLPDDRNCIIIKKCFTKPVLNWPYTLCSSCAISKEKGRFITQPKYKIYTFASASSQQKKRDYNSYCCNAGPRKVGSFANNTLGSTVEDEDKIQHW